MSASQAVAAFLIPAVGLPVLGALIAPREPRIEVVELASDAPCPTVSTVRRQVSSAPPDDRLERVRTAETELWDIPDPIFGKPIPWPDEADLDEHTSRAGFRALIDGRLPEGVDVTYDCSEYPCFASFRMAEDPHGQDVLGDFLESLCTEFGCDEEQTATQSFSLSAKGYTITAFFALGSVEAHQEWRLEGRSSVLSNGTWAYEEPEWLKNAERRPQ